MSGIKLIEKALLKTGYEFAHLGWNSDEWPTHDCGVYYETSVISFNADMDEVAESCLSGQVVYCTRDLSGKPLKQIEKALRSIDDISLSPATIDIQPDKQLYLYKWNWTLI